MYSSSCILMISSGCFKLIRRSSWFSFECGTFWYLQQESFFWNPIREMELHRADPWKNYYFDQFHMQFKVPHNAEDWQNQKWSDLYPFRLLCFSVIYAKKKQLPLSFNFMSLNSKNWKNLIWWKPVEKVTKTKTIWWFPRSMFRSENFSSGFTVS